MATLTLTFSSEHASRIQDALEESKELVDEDGEPRAATMADFKDYIIGDVVRFVRTSERRVAQKAAASSVSLVAIT